MTSKFKFGIATQVVLITVLAFLFLAMTVAGASIYVLNKHNDKSYLAEKNKLIILAEKTFSQIVWNIDTDSLKEVANTMVGQDQSILVGIKIKGDSSKINYMAINHSYQDLSYDRLRSLPDIEHVEGSITLYAKKLGRVELLLSKKKYQEEMGKIIKTVIVISFISILFIGVFMYFVLNQLFTSPLTMLMNGVREIEKGNYQTKMNEHLDNEIGTLARVLNSMIRNISHRDKLLRDYSDNLEHLVVDRERELQDQRLKAINSARLVALGEVSAGIAHEINNPLTVIDGKVRSLKHLLTKNDQAQDEFCEGLSTIQRMSERIAKIVKSMKSLSRDTTLEEFSIVRVGQLISDVKELFQTKLKYHNIDFNVSVENEELHIKCKEIQLSQVLLNLINNAYDAIIDLPEEKKWIMLKIFSEDGFLKFIIQDSGNGISKEVAEKIFQPFFTTKDVGKGTGLGLSISFNIIKAHGGHFYYDTSSPHTQFVFTIPLK